MNAEETESLLHHSVPAGKHLTAMMSNTANAAKPYLDRKTMKRRQSWNDLAGVAPSRGEGNKNELWTDLYSNPEGFY